MSNCSNNFGPYQFPEKLIPLTIINGLLGRNISLYGDGNNIRDWMHADDQRGWFEWYCKYFLGRRHLDDERQIKRWLSFCGPKGRWRNAIYSKIHSYGIDIKLSSNFSIRIQQSLLHWSYMINEQDYKLWMKNKKK